MRLMSSEIGMERMFFRSFDVIQQRFSDPKLPLSRFDTFMRCPRALEISTKSGPRFSQMYYTPQYSFMRFEKAGRRHYTCATRGTVRRSSKVRIKDRQIMPSDVSFTSICRILIGEGKKQSLLHVVRFVRNIIGKGDYNGKR